jgi:hypothetical protein
MIYSMDVRAEINYPTASPEQAFALAVNPEFRAAVCEATHAVDYDVSIEEHDDGGAFIAVERTVPADLSDFVKKLVGDTVSIKQTEEWTPPDGSGRRTADIVVDILGQPAKMVGTAVLEAVGHGSCQVILGDLKVAIPFLGKKIEPEIAKGIVAAVAKEQETGEAWLSGPAI